MKYSKYPFLSRAVTWWFKDFPLQFPPLITLYFQLLSPYFLVAQHQQLCGWEGEGQVIEFSRVGRETTYYTYWLCQQHRIPRSPAAANPSLTISVLRSTTVNWRNSEGIFLGRGKRLIQFQQHKYVGIGNRKQASLQHYNPHHQHSHLRLMRSLFTRRRHSNCRINYRKGHSAFNRPNVVIYYPPHPRRPQFHQETEIEKTLDRRKKAEIDKRLLGLIKRPGGVAHIWLDGYSRAFY